MLMFVLSGCFVFKCLSFDLPDFNQAPGRGLVGVIGEEGVNPPPVPLFIQSVYDRKPIALIVFLFFHCSCLVVVAVFFTVRFLLQRPALTGLE